MLRNKDKIKMFKLVSLRPRRNVGASNFIIVRLLRHFVPRNDTLLVSENHFFNDSNCSNMGISNLTYREKILSVIRYSLSVFFILHFSFFCFAQDKFVYDAKGKRNPFIPLVTADGRLLKLDFEETKGELSIEGIIYDEQGMSYAIVNGSVVKAGDLVNNAQVIKVEKDSVTFVKDGKELKLELLNKNREE